MTGVQSSDRFLDSLRQSQILDAAELDHYLARLAAEGQPLPEAEELASSLVRDGLLTTFQSERLLQAKWQGFLLGGKYRLLELLGAGGMGRVFLCEHVRMRKLVALKVLPPGQLAEPSALERFYREARAAANLIHPNLVRSFDVDEDGEFHFLVMEYVHGVSLHDLVRRKGPLDIARAADCIRQTAEGLQYVHEQGLVHRDIKPGNILLDWQGTIKILDLGLARFRQESSDRLTDESSGGSILGTADYLAPEQAVSSHNVTIQADIYGLGATFYFLLTGHAPFEEGTLTQKMLWHQMREPPSLRNIRAEVPAELETVVMRMLAKDPAERHPSPAAVAVSLAPWTRQPPPLPQPNELPPLCPAVQRLLPAPAPAPRPVPIMVVTPTGEAFAARAPATDTARSSTTSASLSAPVGASPAPRTWSRRVLMGLGIVAVVGMLSGGYFTLHLLRPPAIPPVNPGDLEGFDPFTGIDKESILSARLAAGQVGQTRTVRMSVRDRHRDKDGVIYLFADRTPKGKRFKVFTIVIDQDAQQRFRDASIADPYQHYWGTVIDVTGTIQCLQNDIRWHGIELKDPEKIQIVEK